jgi:hypothetical protein
LSYDTRSLLGIDAIPDLSAIDAHAFRRLDADANLGTIHCHDRYFDVVTDDQGLSDAAS